MEQQIQDLIASIRKDGIETAQKESENIISQAEAKAAQIVKAAEEKSSAILSAAEKEAELSRSSAEALIRQSARDVALSLKKSIEEKYTAILRDKAAEAMHGDKLVSLIRSAIEGDVSGKAVELSASDMEALRSSLSSAFAEEIKKGMTVRSSSSVSSGFRISEKDGSGYVDYSADECVRLLLPHLSESLREIIL